MVFTLQATEAELKAIEWASNRYGSAEVLWQAIQEFGCTLPEYKVWEVLEAIEEEDGKQIPCVPDHITLQFLEWD